jgi:hypothetical protein
MVIARRSGTAWPVWVVDAGDVATGLQSLPEAGVVHGQVLELELGRCEVEVLGQRAVGAAEFGVPGGEDLAGAASPRPSHRALPLAPAWR